MATEKLDASPSSASKRGDEIISAATSQRICRHMNEDHAVSVYAMAKSKVKLVVGNKWKISDAILKKVDPSGCHIQVILCRDDLCQAQKVMYSFQETIVDGAQVRSRLVAIHQRECMPRYWYKQHTLFVSFIMMVYALLAWATLKLGPDTLVETIEEREDFNRIISQYFGSARTFSRLVQLAFYVTLMGHSLLAFYVVYNGWTRLKLTAKTCAVWALAVSVAGLPVVQEFRELLEVDRKCKSAKKEDKTKSK